MELWQSAAAIELTLSQRTKHLFSPVPDMKRSPHFRLLALGVLLALPQRPASAQLSPEKELATFQLEAPLHAELVAGDPTVESPEVVANRIRRALPFVDPKNLLIAPDCGMKYLPREAAFGKLQAMVAGAQMVRAQLASGKG